MLIQLSKDFLGKKTGERIDVPEAEAKVFITQGIAEAVEGDPISDAIAKSAASMMTKMEESFNKAIEEALKKFAAAASKSRKNSVPAIFGSDASGDPSRTFGSFLTALRNGSFKTLEEMGSYPADWDNVNQKVALNTQAGVQGGFTVPTEFVPQLLMVASENTIMEQRATKIPMSANTAEVPALNMVTAPTAGETAFFGGIQANWTEEAATKQEEEPTFRQIRLTAHELSGYTIASNQLLADNAIGLEAVLITLFGGALGWYRDHAFLRGDGAGKPLGVLNSGALISVTRNGFSAFTLADAAGMLARLLPGWNFRSTVWAMHPTVLPKLWTMSGNSGTSSDVVFIDQTMGATKTPATTLLGIPIQVTEKLPALNTLGDVLLIDAKHYLIGDRMMVEIGFSEHYKFISNQGTWRFVSRVDGQPWLSSAITLSDATSTLSPFVGLAAG